MNAAQTRKIVRAVLVPLLFMLSLSGIANAQLPRNGRLIGPTGGVPDRETVVELTYRVDLRKGAFFIQPDLQYINRSGGISPFKNALVVGAQFGINF